MHIIWKQLFYFQGSQIKPKVLMLATIETWPVTTETWLATTGTWLATIETWRATTVIGLAITRTCLVTTEIWLTTSEIWLPTTEILLTTAEIWAESCGQGKAWTWAQETAWAGTTPSTTQWLGSLSRPYSIRNGSRTSTEVSCPTFRREATSTDYLSIRCNSHWPPIAPWSTGFHKSPKKGLFLAEKYSYTNLWQSGRQKVQNDYCQRVVVQIVI